MSLYKTRSGAFVVPVTNRLPNPTDVTVTVNLKVLGLEGKALTAVDQRTNQPLEFKDGAFTVPVQGRNYTFVSLIGR